MCYGTTGKEILMMVSEPRTRLETSLSKEGEDCTKAEKYELAESSHKTIHSMQQRG